MAMLLLLMSMDLEEQEEDRRAGLDTTKDSVTSARNEIRRSSEKAKNAGRRQAQLLDAFIIKAASGRTCA